MKLLRGILDRIEPQFEKGGRFERLYPLYEAGDTFLYSAPDVTKSGSHVRDGMDLKRMMILVVVALLPCIYMALWNTGYQANLAIYEGASPVDNWRSGLFTDVLGMQHDHNSWISNMVLGSLFFLPAYIVTMAVGGTIEAIFSIVRKHEINEGFLVTGMLFPLTLPPTIPLWQVAAGIGFGVLVGKEIFGGTGKNFLNPALTARAFLYFAHAQQITGETVWTAVNPDGFSGATTLGALADKNNATLPLGEVLSQVDSGRGIDTTSAFFGWIQGSMGETSVLACLLGAALLIFTGIGSWRIMVGCVIGAVVTSGLFWVITPENTNVLLSFPPWWHLLVGGFAFGTVFMATDPVSAAMTQSGKWIYGILVGMVTILVRSVSPAFPEGIMLAILLGNVLAPTIDYFVLQANISRRKARYAS